MAMTGGTAYKVHSSSASGFSIALYLYVVVGEQNIANATTKLSLGMYVKTPGSAYDIDWTDFDGSYIGLGAFGNGSQQKTSFTKSVSGGGTIWLKQNVEVTVYHNDDGTAVDVPIIWKWGVSSSWGGFVTPSGTKKIDLPTIPRVSSVVASNGAIGSAIPITISRESSSFTHTLKYSFAGKSGTIASKTSKTVVSWTPDMTLCALLPSARSGKCTITCETYSGSTLVGTDTANITLSVPTSVKVSCADGWVTVSPVNTGTGAEGLELYIASFSKAQITIDESKINLDTAYGATIDSYKVTVNGTELASPYLTATLKTAGEIQVTCTVYDSRGRSVSKKLTFEVLAYSKPTVVDVNCYRCDELGNKDEKAGSYISVTADVSYAELDGNNSASLKARFKATGGSYGSYFDLTPVEAKIVGEGNVDIKSSYTVQIRASDALGKSSAPITVSIPSGNVFFRGMPGGKGASFNKYPEHEGYLDMGFGIWMDNTYIKDVPLPVEIGDAVPKGYVDDNFFGYCPIANYNNDCDVLMKSGWHHGFFRCNSSVLNTPYAHGLTTFNSALILSYATSESYGTQVAFPSGSGHFYLRSMNDGVIGEWKRFQSGYSETLHSGTLKSGSITFDYGPFSMYLIVGRTGDGRYPVSMVIPKGYFYTTARSMQLSDREQYLSFEIIYTDKTATLTILDNSTEGFISRIYGIY